MSKALFANDSTENVENARDHVRVQAFKTVIAQQGIKFAQRKGEPPHTPITSRGALGQSRPLLQQQQEANRPRNTFTTRWEESLSGDFTTATRTEADGIHEAHLPTDRAALSHKGVCPPTPGTCQPHFRAGQADREFTWG